MESLEPALPGQDKMPDDLNSRIGVLTRREVEARLIAPLVEALAAEFGRERVVAVIRDTITQIAREQGETLAERMGGRGMLEFAETLGDWTKDGALELDILAQDDTRFDFDVTRCRYAELYAALGIADLGTVLSCNRDGALITGFNQEIELTRTQTLMEGAPFCNFRYRQRGLSPLEPRDG